MPKELTTINGYAYSFNTNSIKLNMIKKILSQIIKWLKDNNFYNIGMKEIELQREPRWPVEMQVLPDKIRHINVVPKEQEPFYVKTGLEETHMGYSDPKYKTVYYYNPINCGYVSNQKSNKKFFRFHFDFPSNQKSF